MTIGAPKIGAPIIMLAAAALLFMFLRSGADNRQRAENAGVTRVVALQNDSVIETLRAENAQLLAQRNAAWEAENNAGKELARQQAEIERLAAGNDWWRAHVPADLLCAHNATLDLEAGRSAAPCGAAALPGAAPGISADQLVGLDETSTTERGTETPQ